MRKKKISGDLLKKNEEYTKLRGAQTSADPPRETPGQQSPAGRGYGKPDLADWTTEELRDMAVTLDVADAPELTRDELVAALNKADATRSRLKAK